MLPSYGDKTTGSVLREYISTYHGISPDKTGELLGRHAFDLERGKKEGDLVGWVADKILYQEGHRCTDKCVEPREH